MAEQPFNWDNYTVELHPLPNAERPTPSPRTSTGIRPASGGEWSRRAWAEMLLAFTFLLVMVCVFSLATYSQFQERRAALGLLHKGTLVSGKITAVRTSPAIDRHGRITMDTDFVVDYRYESRGMAFPGKHSDRRGLLEGTRLGLNAEGQIVTRRAYEVGDAIFITLDPDDPATHRVGKMTAERVPSFPWFFAAGALVFGVLLGFFGFALVGIWREGRGNR